MADFGFGWRVKPSGEIDLTMDGKIKLVNDRENLGQQLSLRLLSPKGSHPFDPNFGLDMRVVPQYRKLYQDVTDLLQYVITDCLNKHPGVASVDYIIAEDKGNRLWEVQVKVISTDGVETMINTTFEQSYGIDKVLANVTG
jgi:hypothetical protein